MTLHDILLCNACVCIRRLHIQIQSGLACIKLYIAWWKVREVWREEARSRSKLALNGRLMDYGCKAQCVEVNCKRQRSTYVGKVERRDSRTEN